MSNQVFVVFANRLVDPEIFAYWYDRQRPKRKEGIDRMRFDKGKRLSLAAGIAMEKALDEAGFSGADIGYTEAGKPFVTGGKSYFNITHTDEIALCAISDREVGIDVEGERSFGDSLIRYTFSEDEIRLADAIAKRLGKSVSSKTDLDRVFVRFWTIKESLMKWSGLGLGLSPKAIRIYEEPENILRATVSEKEYEEVSHSLYFSLYEYGVYQVSVCSTYPEFLKEETIIDVDVEEMD